MDAPDVKAYVLKQDKTVPPSMSTSPTEPGARRKTTIGHQQHHGLNTTVDLILALAEERGLHK